MTKKRFWFMVMTAFAVSVVIVFSSMAAAVTHPKPQAEEMTEAAVTQTQISYILKTWNGHLGLFRSSSDSPYREIDMPLYLLTEHDRKLLDAGISVNTEEELNALVEDIVS